MAVERYVRNAVMKQRKIPFVISSSVRLTKLVGPYLKILVQLARSLKFTNSTSKFVAPVTSPLKGFTSQKALSKNHLLLYYNAR